MDDTTEPLRDDERERLNAYDAAAILRADTREARAAEALELLRGEALPPHGGGRMSEQAPTYNGRPAPEAPSAYPPWRDPDVELPDSDETVLVECDGDEPVWLGYHDGAQWLSVEGEAIAVTGWMPLPPSRSLR